MSLIHRIKHFYRSVVSYLRLYRAQVIIISTVLVIGILVAVTVTSQSMQHPKSALHAIPTTSASPNPTLAPTPSTTPGPIIAAPKPVQAADQGLNFGIAAGGGLSSIGTTDLNVRFKDMRNLGIRWVRFDVDWSEIQPDSSNAYNWAGYDRVVAALQANGLSGLGIITYTPAWARSSECTTSNKCSPSNPAVFAKFAGIVAARYAPKGIHTWEIWNEPNITDFWLPSANTAAYTQMLKLSYRNIKLTDAHSTVLTGGTASTGTGKGSLSPADFVAGIYANGGYGYFDAVANHPYSRPFLPSFDWYWNAWQQMANTKPNIRSIMVANGDAAKKIWITEYGTPTGGPGGLATNGLILSERNDDHVTEALQSRTVTTAIAMYRTYSWAGPFFWYSYKDNGTSQDDAENFYGLIRANGTHKPAYGAYQSAIAKP